MSELLFKTDMLSGPAYSCPDCDRPTLQPVPDEIVDYQCAVCGGRVDERGAV